MVHLTSFLAVAAVFQATLASPSRPHGALNIVDSIDQTDIPTNVAPKGLTTKSGYFNQTVDHFGNTQGVNGTWFNQLYFIQDTYYKPGGPIFFFLCGESACDDLWLQGGKGSLISWLLPGYNGMAVSLEHRFYGAGADPDFPGRSTPTADLSYESLKLLTTRQAVEDNVNFIKKFPSVFPQYGTNSSTKWITIGGSYPGALSAIMKHLHPDVVYAAHASSAPTEFKLDFWKYSYAVDQGQTFLSNLFFGTGDACTKGWTRAVKLFDTAIAGFIKNKDDAGLAAFKNKFWMGSVVDIGDVAAGITSDMAGVVQYYPRNVAVDKATYLDVVCDAKQFPAFSNATATDAEIMDALVNHWIYVLQNQYKVTDPNDTTIAASFNTVAPTDFSLAGGLSANLFWWQGCNEFGYGQVAEPLDGGLIEDWSVYSQYNSEAYFQSFCKTVWNSNPTDASIDAQNAVYGGINMQESNILWVNGQYDPWHWLSQGFLEKTAIAGQDALFYNNASHCNDLWGPVNTTTAWNTIGTVSRAYHWPPVTADYEGQFFQQLFAVYDKWILGSPASSVTSSSSASATATASPAVATGTSPAVVSGTSAVVSGTVTAVATSANASAASTYVAPPVVASYGGAAAVVTTYAAPSPANLYKASGIASTVSAALFAVAALLL
ncbi:serine carboxypeptidase S28-domain-containing protein [Chytriomyces sp. MP71]|nr:serine carboxypeptidase S28-domain-containing protein [Chytriomyces sp. MP71]